MYNNMLNVLIQIFKEESIMIIYAVIQKAPLLLWSYYHIFDFLYFDYS